MGHNSSDDAEVNKRVEEGQASLAAYNGNGRDMGGGGFFSGQRPVSEALITALLGAGRGMQAAQGAEGPWGALIAGASGGAETAMAVEQKRREEGMRRMAMTPLGVAHPALAETMKAELGFDAGSFTLSQIKELTPFFKLASDQKKAARAMALSDERIKIYRDATNRAERSRDLNGLVRVKEAYAKEIAGNAGLLMPTEDPARYSAIVAEMARIDGLIRGMTGGPKVPVVTPPPKETKKSGRFQVEIMP